MTLSTLGDQLLDDLAVDIRKPIVAALESIDKTRVVKSHEVQNCGLQVVYVHGIACHGEPQFIGLAVRIPAFNATT